MFSAFTRTPVFGAYPCDERSLAPKEAQVKKFFKLYAKGIAADLVIRKLELFKALIKLGVKVTEGVHKSILHCFRKASSLLIRKSGILVICLGIL